MTSQLGAKTKTIGGVVRHPSLQTCLIALVLLVLVPTLGVVGMTLLRAGQSYRDASSQQLLETANVVAQSVTSELEATSRLLAGYAALRQDDALGNDAMKTNALLEGQTGVTLIRKGPSGFIVVAGTGDSAIDAIALAAASTGEAAVSDIVTPQLAGDAAPASWLRFQAAREGATIEVVSLVAKPADLIRSLMRQGAAAGRVVLAITDGTGHVVGRSLDADKFIGKPVPDWKTLVALGTSNGTFQARTIEGADIMFAFQKIDGTPGWVAVVGEPLTAFNDRWQQPVIVMIGASAATILVAFGLAMMLARRILRPIKQLALRARDHCRGQRARAGDLGRSAALLRRRIRDPAAEPGWRRSGACAPAWRKAGSQNRRRRRAMRRCGRPKSWRGSAAGRSIWPPANSPPPTCSTRSTAPIRPARR